MSSARRKARSIVSKSKVSSVRLPRSLLLARDPELARDVWIHLLSPLFGTKGALPALSTSPTSTEQRVRLIRASASAVALRRVRSGRRREPAQGRVAGHVLDVDQRASDVLELCAYMLATPMPLHFEQLWIDHNGRLRVLDFALATSPEPRMEPLDLLARVVRELLQTASHPGVIEGIPARSSAMLARWPMRGNADN